MILVLLACSDKVGDSSPLDSGPVDSGACTPTAWYADFDGDGFGAGAPVEACLAPPSHVATSTDCDDTDAAVFPGAAEIPYDGVDQDCDGSDLDDVDGDGSSVQEDCDDDDPARSPEFDELCDDAIDNDCDDAVDDDCQFFGGVAPAEAAAVIYGEVETVECCGSEAGYFLHGDDFNQDGFGDLVMWSESDGTEFKLMYGPFSGELDTSTAAATLNQQAGGLNSVSLTTGDFNGDSEVDLIIGEPFDTGDYLEGAVAVYFGPIEGWYGPSSYDLLFQGELQDAAGSHSVLADVTGSGEPELVVGIVRAGFIEGEARGDIVAVGSDQDQSLPLTCLGGAGVRHESHGDLGEAFVSADFEGDGVADILALSSSPKDDAWAWAPPAAFVVRGPIDGCVSTADSDAVLRLNDTLSIATETTNSPAQVDAYDSTGDGVADLVLSGTLKAAEGLPSEGTALIFSGPVLDFTDATSPTARITASEETVETRLVAQNCGDFDSDGFVDTCFGVTSPNGASGGGSTYILFGPVSGTFILDDDAFGRLDGDIEPFESCETDGCEHPGSLFGWSLVGGDDYTGDGFPDVVVGSPGFEYDTGTNDKGPGAVYVYSGQ
ncbi:MAG: hypothetical protein GY871_15330 [Actinomycetales bacterium]|nr:hypothetical protein [Actinomycetales bacterium]